MLSRALRSLSFCSLSLTLILFFTHFTPLSAYVIIPRSNADTTNRMNAGGDPPDRSGLRDDQRSPEYLDDWWGRNDYYYSEYGIHENQTIRNPAYNAESPPYYPWPNEYYDKDPNVRYYNTNTRYYRPYLSR